MNFRSLAARCWPLPSCSARLAPRVFDGRAVQLREVRPRNRIAPDQGECGAKRFHYQRPK
jgi:hypothetical protein